MSELVNVFTVDVEDYFQVSAFEPIVERSTWDGFESRVVINTHRIMALLDRHGVHATFFVLGWVAERFPQLVRDIHSAGHEIGSHGYWHRLIYTRSPAEFRDDVRRSRDLLEAIIDEKVVAYRAPSFSITNQSRWALEVLAEEGFTVSSSIFPIHHDRYGIPDASRTLHVIETPSGPLWEFPPTVARFPGLNLPVGGGGYFRLYPMSLTLGCLRRVHRATRQPFMFYIHPWEIDPGQPRFRSVSRLTRFRHYVNLHKTEEKLRSLLGTFRFGRLCDAIPKSLLPPRSDVGHHSPPARPDLLASA
jgi:polysaccharide deacetylase family protein (PEP-CTERM system associated)